MAHFPDTGVLQMAHCPAWARVFFGNLCPEPAKSKSLQVAKCNTNQPLVTIGWHMNCSPAHLGV